MSRGAVAYTRKKRFLKKRLYKFWGIKNLSFQRKYKMKDFSKIKLLVCDCDGVLTDGLMVFNSQGSEVKHFSAYDGFGIRMIKHSKLQIAIITGHYSKALELRCNDLGVQNLFQKVNNKRKVLEELMASLGITYENVAYIGDDWNDFVAMRDCHLKIAPKNARELFKMTVDYVTDYSGGYGAVRDAIEYILKSRNEFEEVLQRYLDELSEIKH
jgi:3-deoxy-D-manno-octulosonate 8-phosphate phosphatase (KDO 8-P phosphatase)